MTIQTDIATVKTYIDCLEEISLLYIQKYTSKQDDKPYPQEVVDTMFIELLSDFVDEIAIFHIRLKEIEES